MVDHHYGVRDLKFNDTHTLFYLEAVNDNKALRSANQPMSEISFFWEDPSTEIQQEWSRWIEHFGATLMAKPSISLEELKRDDSGTLRRKELMGGAEEPIAQKKLSISCILLSERQHEKRYWTESRIWI